MHTYIWLIVWWSPSRDGDGICKLYIYTHVCVYVCSMCMCKCIQCVYVRVHVSLPFWMVIWESRS